MAKSLTRQGGFPVVVHLGVMGLVACCSDPALARGLVARGVHVVLVGVCADATAAWASAACDAASSRAGPASSPAGPGGGPAARRPGRLALLVGDPADANILEAAGAMGRELFGANPVTVRTPADAELVVARSDTVDDHPVA